MERAKRKLANRRGMSFVFALIVFLILTLFSLLITSASLSALQSSVLLRNIEKAHSSVHAVARFVQSSLKEAPDLTFTDAWDKSQNPIVQKVLTDALNNGSAELIWSVEDGEAENVCPDVRLSVAADYRTGEALAAVADNASLCKPAVTIRISHLNYKMTLRITACDVQRNENGYAVSFADSQGELRVSAKLGAS